MSRAEIKAMLRFAVALWAGLVWLLLIALPAFALSGNLQGFALHFPYALIGLVILGGLWLALRALADLHAIWFASVLFLLGTWM